MNSSAATGPMGSSWVATGVPLASTVACRSGALWYALKFSGVPCHTSTRLPTSETGSRTQSRARTRSTQKLPRNLVRSRASPRMKAIPTASPARAGQEILGHQSHNLAEVAESGLAGVGLPRGGGGEADRRVHREVGRHRVRPKRRVERMEQGLNAEDPVEEQCPGEAEQQERGGVLPPVHLALWIDAAETMDRSFERTEEGVEARPLAGEDALEIAADRLDEDEHETEKQGVLQQADAVHLRPFRRPSARLGSLVRTGPSVAWGVWPSAVHGSRVLRTRRARFPALPGRRAPS